jgi:mono/diheme cytochrome c family protein
MLMQVRTPFFLLILAAAISQSVYAAGAAAGRKLSEQWCARCHHIEKGAPLKLHPRSFASIAVYRPAGDIFSKVFAPQHDMPDIKWVLQAEEIEDLTAYITSLEEK